MFKKIDYMNFREMVDKLVILDDINKLIDIKKLAANSTVKTERVKEFIATNNIENDIISFDTAKSFLNAESSKTKLQKRWMGIKYASDLVWNDKYTFTLEYLHEVHRALLGQVDLVGGNWKTKLNQVGSLLTADPAAVPGLMMDLFTKYTSAKLAENPSVFNVIPFISEFLAIHPYEDGNGRISRLIMNKELYDAGYKFIKYISVSKYLWEDKKRYIDALESRNEAWASKTIMPRHLLPLFDVILDSLIKAAKEAKGICDLTIYKQNDFNKKLLDNLYKPMSISNIMDELKIGNSRSLINKWLKSLVNNNIINMTGKLKASKYERVSKTSR